MRPRARELAVVERAIPFGQRTNRRHLRLLPWVATRIFERRDRLDGGARAPVVLSPAALHNFAAGDTAAQEVLRPLDPVLRVPDLPQCGDAPRGQAVQFGAYRLGHLLQGHGRFLPVTGLDRPHQPPMKDCAGGINLRLRRNKRHFEIYAGARSKGVGKARMHRLSAARTDVTPDFWQGLGDDVVNPIETCQAFPLLWRGHDCSSCSATSVAISAKLRPLPTCRASSPVWACQRRIAVST